MALVVIAAMAQGEQDFASKFMDLYGGQNSSLSCATVSPAMMEKMLNLKSIGKNANAKQVFSQLKSIRVVTSQSHSKADTYFAKAIRLAEDNSRRYKLYAEAADKSIYKRERGRWIVELVMVINANDSFSIIDLTGNMTKEFIKTLESM